MDTWKQVIVTVLAQASTVSVSRAQPAPTAPMRPTLSLPIIPPPPAGQSGRSLVCAVPYGPTAGVAAVAFSPDGKPLASTGNQDMLLWDLANAKLLRRVGAGQLNDQAHVLAFHKDGHLLAFADGVPYGPGSVKLFNVDTGELAISFQEPRDVVYAVAFSPDGKWLVAGGADNTLRICSVEEKKNVATFKDHTDWIRCVAFGSDSKYLANAGDDQVALVWEVGTWKRLNRLEEKDPIRGVAFNPDAQLVLLAVAGVDDKVLRLRRRDNGDVARVNDLGVNAPTDLVWLHATNRIFVSGTDQTVRIFDGGNGGLLKNGVGHSGWVHRVVVSPDGTKLASASADGTVRLWNAAEGTPLATFVNLVPRTDEWLIATTAGYLMTSSPAALQWNASGLTMPTDQIPGLFQNFELVKQILTGIPVAAPNIP